MKSETPTMKDIYGGGAHIIKFGSPTCAPCAKISPIYEGLSKDRRFSNVDFWDIDISDPKNDDLVRELSIRTAPTIITVKDGMNLKVMMGQHQVTKTSLEEALYDIVE